jgi:hypothetical protein
MNLKQVLEAMSKGEVLCMGYSNEGNGKEYWLEPRRAMVRCDVAERVISIVGIEIGGDRLFTDASSQTWKMNNEDRVTWGKRKKRKKHNA